MARAEQESSGVSEASIGLEIAAAAADFYRRGWCLGTSGNFSAVLAARPLQLLITRSGRSKEALDVGQFVRVDSDGRPYAGEAGVASAETQLHLAVCRSRAAGSVLHTHSVAGTLLGEHFCDKGGISFADYEMMKGLEGIDSHQTEAFLPVLANSQDMAALALEVERVLAERPASHGFLLAGHGLYTWGADVAQARRHVEIFEFLFEVLLRRTQLTPFGG